MDHDTLKSILTKIAAGSMTVGNAVEKLQHLFVENIGFAQIDHHRSLRKGFPEVIFGEGKTADQIIGIMEKMIRQERIVLVTRVASNKGAAICSALPGVEYDTEAKMLIFKNEEIKIRGRGTILVLSAGTSDIPVAKEAVVTAEAMGNQVKAVFDVGVAGIHRLMKYVEDIEKASVLIVVAGMEGALPSVVAGMVQSPVIAVPTSVGYGVSLGGLTALFAMLNSCSSNVAVVNIDNGFGAGYLASSINRI